MKTFFASAFALLFTLSAAFAGNKTSLPHGCARHHQAVWQDNTVIFGYQGEKGSSYKWVQQDGPARAKLTGTHTPTLIASNLAPGSYIFSLTTTTPDGYKSTDSIVVKVKNPSTVAQL